MRSVLLLVLASSAAAYVLMPAVPPAVPCAQAYRSSWLTMQVEDEAEPPIDSAADSPAAADEPPMDVEPVAEPEESAFDSPFTTDDDVVIDESNIAKEALKAEIADGLTGARPDKAVVGEILLALEAQNPTASPATSPLLNGKWKFLYASGASPGLKALMAVLKGAKQAPKSPSGADIIDVADTYLTIQPEQPRATSEVKIRLLSFENTVKLSSKLDAESAVRLVETYDAAESEYGSLRLPFQSPVQYKRSVLISYLDDEMLVVRDALGRPDVLMRAEAPPATATGDMDTDDDAPSDVDDAAP